MSTTGRNAKPSADDITIRLPRDLIEQVRRLADEHERSLAAELRVALRSYIEAKR
jgi:predicted transcriptional regulator